MSAPLDLAAIERNAVISGHAAGAYCHYDQEAHGCECTYYRDDVVALLAHCRALRAALAELTMGKGHHTVICGIPRECTCGQDAARAVLASVTDGEAAP